MDNFHFDMTSEGKEQLKTALSLFPHQKVVAYRIDAEKGMILYWIQSTNALSLPFAMSLSQAADFVSGWLEEAAPYGAEPDHDGDNGKGWRLYNESWGRIGDESSAFAAVQPVWAMYGK